jgi:hypothetical protein
MAKKLSSFDQEPGAAMLFSYFNEISIISQLSGAMFEKELPFGLSYARQACYSLSSDRRGYDQYFAKTSCQTTHQG